MYYIYRNISSDGNAVMSQYVTATADTQHMVSSALGVSYDYSYYFIANSCVGNSTSISLPEIIYQGEFVVVVVLCSH